MNLKIILFILLFFFAACANPFNETKLYGIWEGYNANTKLVIKFNNDGTCEIRSGGVSDTSLKKITGKYQVEFSKKPIPLSITDMPQINHPLHTIIEFQDDNLIKIGEFAPRWRLRPISFTKNSEILLKRSPKK